MSRVALTGITCLAAAAGACAPDAARDAANATGARADAAGTGTVDVTAVDDFGTPLPLDDSFSTRVVSLNPTATEVIFALGQSARLVGRSAWDEFPAEALTIPSVGDGIRPNVEAVLAMRPTLVILYATSENRQAADALARAGIRTIALRVDRIEQFLHLTRVLGTALGASASATAITDSVTRTLDRVREVVRDASHPRVAWPLWSSPIMVVGGGSYLDELLQVAGARNVFGDAASPSPQVSIEEIARRDPDLLLVGNTGVDAITIAPGWRAIAAVREGRVQLVDTRLTGRPSVNLGMAAVSLARVLHPDRASRLP